jgi:hypothetical protein
MIDILSENSKMNIQSQLMLEEKRFVQGVCYFINKIPNILKKKEYVQNMNSIFLELS